MLLRRSLGTARKKKGLNPGINCTLADLCNASILCEVGHLESINKEVPIQNRSHAAGLPPWVISDSPGNSVKAEYIASFASTGHWDCGSVCVDPGGASPAQRARKQWLLAENRASAYSGRTFK
jgi:hypothetical protein